MGEAPSIGAHFILALDDQHPALTQYPMRFPAGLHVEVHNGFVVFAGGQITGFVVFVVVFNAVCPVCAVPPGECM